MLLLAALASFAPLGRKFFAEQWAALSDGKLRLYGATFRDVTRWSLLGVIFTELTVNAHAYLVTFVAGSGPFALLALGMLLMRPASLVQSALPDLERPVMTRQIAARDWRGLARTRKEFGAGLFAMLAGTLMLDTGLLLWFPSLILKKGYSLHAVIIVAAISAVIMAMRCLRAPPAVLLQAVGAFKQSAAISLKSSAISLAATLILLLAFGPIASLGGVRWANWPSCSIAASWHRPGRRSVAEHVTIAIPTFRRPKNLQRLLDAIARLDGDADIRVLVADNDAEGQDGIKLCARLAPDYRWPLRAVVARQRGIAQVRNTLFAEALADCQRRLHRHDR